jgi:hypothetical protein
MVSLDAMRALAVRYRQYSKKYGQHPTSFEEIKERWPQYAGAYGLNPANDIELAKRFLPPDLGFDNVHLGLNDFEFLPNPPTNPANTNPLVLRECVARHLSNATWQRAYCTSGGYTIEATSTKDDWAS